MINTKKMILMMNMVKIDPNVVLNDSVEYSVYSSIA